MSSLISDADEVLRKGSYKVGEKTWVVRRQPSQSNRSVETNIAEKTPDKPVEMQPDDSSSKAHSRTVDVHGIEGQERSFIQTIFENKQLSGGGPVLEIMHDPDTQHATICFQNPEGEWTTCLTVECDQLKM